jgi:hypothetical protein
VHAGVVQQVLERPTHDLGVDHDPLVEVDVEVDAARAERRHARDARADERTDVHRGSTDLLGLVAQPLQVEQVLQHPGEPLGALVQRGDDVVLLLLGQLVAALQEGRAEPEDHRHRGAQLVRDRVEERRLQPVEVPEALGDLALAADRLGEPPPLVLQRVEHLPARDRGPQHPRGGAQHRDLGLVEGPVGTDEVEPDEAPPATLDVDRDDREGRDVLVEQDLLLALRERQHRAVDGAAGGEHPLPSLHPGVGEREVLQVVVVDLGGARPAGTTRSSG